MDRRRRNRNDKLNVKKVSVFKRLRPHPHANNVVNDDDSFNSSSSSSSPPLVVVTGMPSDCTVMELKSRFEIFGQISRTRIDSNDGAGYVTFRSGDSVEAALSASHDSESGIEIRSKKVTVYRTSDPLLGWKAGTKATAPPILSHVETALDKKHSRSDRRSAGSLTSKSSTELPHDAREIVAYDDLF